MKQSQVDRAARYRKRAGETRSKADDMTESFSRRTMLEVAETWERLAAKEISPDTNPSSHQAVLEPQQPPVDPATQRVKKILRPSHRELDDPSPH